MQYLSRDGRDGVVIPYKITAQNIFLKVFLHGLKDILSNTGFYGYSYRLSCMYM